MVTVKKRAIPGPARLRVGQLTSGKLYRAYNGLNVYEGIALATAEEPLLLSCDGVSSGNGVELVSIRNLLYSYEIADDITVKLENGNV